MRHFSTAFVARSRARALAMLGPVSNRPHDVTLSRRLLWAVFVPVVLLVLVGAILGYQILRLQDEARWVDQSDQVVAKSYELLKRILDYETGIRGFLLTDDQRFLEALNMGQAPESLLRELEVLTRDDPEQQKNLALIRQEFVAWLDRVKGDPEARCRAFLRMLQ